MDGAADLHEVEREERHSKNFSAWIDVASPPEAIATVLGLMLATAVVIATACLGPGPVSLQRADRMFTNFTTHTFRFNAAPLSRLNRFVSFGLRFVLANDSTATPPVSFRYSVETSGRGWVATPLNATVSSFALRFARLANSSAELPLFADRFIAYESADLTLSLPPPPPRTYGGITVTTAVGACHHTAFQCYFRVLFSLVELRYAWLFAGRWDVRGFAGWPPERRLCLALLLAAPLANNPAAALRPSRPLAAVEAVCAAALRGLSCVMALALLLGVLRRSEPVAPPVALGAAVFAPACAAALYELFHRAAPGVGVLGRGLRRCEGAAALAFAARAALLIARALVADATERLRATLCAAAATAVAAVAVAVGAPAAAAGVAAPGTGVAEFAVYNGFALIVAAMQWPVPRGASVWSYRSGVRPAGEPTEDPGDRQPETRSA
jgi:hypothetical protein